MSKHIKKIIIVIISIICIGASFFLYAKSVKAKPSLDQNGYIKTIVGLLNIKSGTKKTLLVNYCNALSNQEIQNGLVDKSMYFTPKYSLFVAALCAPFVKNNESPQPFNASTDNILKNNMSWETLIGTIPPGCDPNGDMNTCDLSILLPGLFASAMNDHSILSIAGRTIGTKDKNSNADIIETFANTYFRDLDKICGGKKNYLSVDSPSDDKSALCSHPKTAKYLDSYINTLKRQRNSIGILDMTQIQNQNAKTCAVEGNNLDEMQGGIFLCSYVFKTENAGYYQTNLRYNELLFYKTLITWLTMKLDNPNFKPITISSSLSNSDSEKIIANANNGLDASASGGNNEKFNLQREIILSQKSIILMKKNIYNFRSTFPLHIGLLAYYEDILSLRKTMAKIYTPIHQLYYKLRNVQAK